MKMLKTRLLLRLIAVTSLAAFSPQVIAANTAAGTPIDNTVDVTFDINGLSQDPVSAAAPQFLVDRLVNFTLAPTDGVDTPVTPNEQDAVASFTLTNTSNSPLDFNLAAANLAAGSTVNGGSIDDADMGATFVFSVNNATSGVLPYVDGLAAGASVQIDVLADAPVTLTDAQIAAIRLTVTAALSAATQDSTEGASLVAAATDDPAVVDTVFDAAVASGVNGALTADDGYVVAAANLSVAKSSTIISDPINGTTDPFAVPGAIVEYTLVLSNASATVAENVSISDDLQTALIFEAGNLPSGTGNVSVEIGGTTTYCTAEVSGGDANTDGCFFTGSVLTIGGIDGSGSTVVPLDVGADDATITFRALIDNTP